MQLEICQSCGSIIRGKAKFCTGCGGHISKFSPTALPSAGQSAGPMAVEVRPEPKVLERVIVKQAYSKYNGGNGGNGGKYSVKGLFGSSAQEPGPAEGLQKPAQTSPPQPAQGDSAASKLGSLLGSATGSQGQSKAGSASDMLSYMDNSKDSSARTPEAQPPASPSSAAKALEPADDTPSIEFFSTSSLPKQAPGAAPTASLASTQSTPAQPPAGQMPADKDAQPIQAGPESSAAPAGQAEPTTPVHKATTGTHPAVKAALFGQGLASTQGPDGLSSGTTSGGLAQAFGKAKPFEQPASPGGESVLEIPTQPQVPAQKEFAQTQGQPAGPPEPANPVLSNFNNQGVAPALPPQTAQEAKVDSPSPSTPPAQVQPALQEPSKAEAPPQPFSPFAASPAQPNAAPQSPAPSQPAQAASPEGSQPATPESAPAAPIPPQPVNFFDPPEVAKPAGTPEAAEPAPPAPAGMPPQAAAESAPQPAPPEPQTEVPSASAPAGMPPQAAAESVAQTAEPALPAPVPEPQTPQPSAPPSPAGMDFFALDPVAENATAPPAGPPQTASPTQAQPAAPEPAPAPQPTSPASMDFFASEPPPQPQPAADTFDAAPSAPPVLEASPPPSIAEQPPAVPAVEEKPDEPLVDDDGFPDESINRGKGRAKDDDEDLDEADVEDSDDEEEEEDVKPKIKRRSFSGDDDDEPDRDSSDDEEKTGIMGWLDGEMEIFGKPMPTKAILVGGFVVLLLCFKGLGMVGGMIGGAVDQVKASQVPSIGGQWIIGYAAPGMRGKAQSVMTISQNGNEIQGQGQDQSGRAFRVGGNFQPPNITFAKQYMAGRGQFARPDGPPIVYRGQVEIKPNQYPYAQGVFQYKQKAGAFYGAQPKLMQGQWEGELRDPSAAPTPTPGQGGGQVALPGSKPHWQEQQKQMAIIALGIIVFGISGFAFLSLKIFGPSGLLNIWHKKDYIPSQFKAQHFKMMKQLGKPLKPSGIPLGDRIKYPFEFGKPIKLSLPPDMRESNPHILFLGAGAKGKSRLMAHQICHDIISKDRAVVMIDSDGAISELITRWIASHPKGKSLTKRVLIVDPTHKGDSCAYNPLQQPEDGDLQSAASAIVHGFKAIYTEPPGQQQQNQWTKQTESILRNAALLLMANGRTLTDIPTLLSDNDFRDLMLENIEKRKADHTEFIALSEVWSNYKRLARTDQWLNWIDPILNRINPTLGDPRIRPILTQPKGDLNLSDVIREKKILIVRIPEGTLDQNGNLLGSLIVTGLRQAAIGLSNQKVNPEDRRCALYLDEMDNFIEKETVDSITGETRKLQIALIGSLKTLQHMQEDLRSQMVINMGVMFIFALAKKDGDLLGPQMFRVDGRKMKHQTIQNVFNRVNTSPQFELIADEEKLNIDRVVGQEERTYFCYRVGTVAGVFNMRSPDFDDIPDAKVKHDLIDEMFDSGSKMKAAGARS